MSVSETQCLKVTVKAVLCQSVVAAAADGGYPGELVPILV
jgi:hypothetical protein